MNVVDSSAWLEYFADGPNASFFAEPIEDIEALVVPTLSLFEVFKRVLQQLDESTALQAAAVMQQGTVVDLEATIALNAARLVQQVTDKDGDPRRRSSAKNHSSSPEDRSGAPRGLGGRFCDFHKCL